MRRCSACFRPMRDEDCIAAAHVNTLCQLLDQIDVPAKLCADLRNQGVVEDVCELLSSAEASVHNPALRLLATLTTSDVDPKADETKRRVIAARASHSIHHHLFSSSAFTVAHACAAIQHLSSDPNVASHLEARGGVLRLKELSSRSSTVDAVVKQAASACLERVMHSLARSRRLLHAVILLQRHLRRVMSMRMGSRAKRARGAPSIRAVPTLVWS